MAQVLATCQLDSGKLPNVAPARSLRAVPSADVSGCCVNRLWTLFDHLVGAVEQGGRHRDSDAQRAAARRPRRL
jgi:hypothetical protein